MGVATAVGLTIIHAYISVLGVTAILTVGAYAPIAFVAFGLVAVIMAFRFGELSSILASGRRAYTYAYAASAASPSSYPV